MQALFSLCAVSLRPRFGLPVGATDTHLPPSLPPSLARPSRFRPVPPPPPPPPPTEGGTEKFSMPEHTAVIYTLRRWRTRLIQGGSALSWSFGDTRPTTTTRKPRSPLPCTVYVHTDRSVCTVCGGGGGGGGGKGLFPGTGCFCLLYHVALHTYVRVLEWQGEGRRTKEKAPSLPSSSLLLCSHTDFVFF